MYKPDITVIWSTPDPAQVVLKAARNTTINILDAQETLSFPPAREGESSVADRHAAERLIRYVYRAGHGSILEHVSLCMMVTGVSRSFLAQITRHRHTAFSASSQRYQEYSDYPIIADDMETEAAAARAVEEYKNLVKSGVKPEEARQALPNASAVNLMITASAREWAAILNLRLCKRCSLEMQTWAQEAWTVLNSWFPELFAHVGADCHETECRQGHMQPACCRG